jgi:tetratricopeptide (TPR) repeat protein
MISARKGYAIGQMLKKANDLEIKGKIEEAIEEVRKAVDINPEDGNLYNRLGDLYLKLDQKGESLDNFRKGVEAFRRDNFPRNALALSKKILRNDPDGFDMYYTIADLLVELDEKPNAAQYMFEYIEKQARKDKREEALNAVEYLRTLEIRDDKIQDRILECHKMLTQEEDVEKSTEEHTPEKPDDDEARTDEAKTEKPKAEENIAAAILEEETVRRARKTDKKIDKLLQEFDGTGALRDDIGQLDESVKKVDNAIAGLRKSIRLDTVILALDKSLSALSREQKNALEKLGLSVGDNLDLLQKSIRALDLSSGKNTRETQAMLEKLGKALGSLSKNQASVAKELSANLVKLGENFNTTTENSLKVVKSILANYKEATDEMIVRLDDTKDANKKLIEANDKLVTVNDSMKTELSAMGESLSQYIAGQELKEKKRDRYVFAILAIMSVICGLFVFSVLFK